MHLLGLLQALLRQRADIRILLQPFLYKSADIRPEYHMRGVNWVTTTEALVAAASLSSPLLTANTQKDLPTSSRVGNRFWGGVGIRSVRVEASVEGDWWARCDHPEALSVKWWSLASQTQLSRARYGSGPTSISLCDITFHVDIYSTPKQKITRRRKWAEITNPFGELGSCEQWSYSSAVAFHFVIFAKTSGEGRQSCGKPSLSPTSLSTFNTGPPAVRNGPDLDLANVLQNMELISKPLSHFFEFELTRLSHLSIKLDDKHTRASQSWCSMDFQSQCRISKICSIYLFIWRGPVYFDKVSSLVSPKMSAPDLPPVAFQVAVISAGLNSTIFFAFLMGLSSSTSHLN